MTNATLRSNARELQAEIDRTQPDAVLSILAQPLVFLKNPRRPVYFFADAAFQSFQDTYKGTISVNNRTPDYARQEAEVASRINGVCLGSDWAVADAERVFTAEFPHAQFSSRLHVTPLGANWTPRQTREEVLSRMEARPDHRIQLLYVGVDWLRKGGPLAVEIAAGLRDRGVPAHLHIVGCRPQLSPDVMDIVTIHGPLYRNHPAEAQTLEELFLGSHFLVVPTLAECYGIIFAEAQAFALPPVSRAVGALPTVVRDGQTGLLFSPSAPASEYIGRLLQLHQNRDAYRTMALHARSRFEALLNWDATANSIVQVIERDLSAASASA
jgi:glycosyltransferase involved in cell wall biosynthesis